MDCEIIRQFYQSDKLFFLYSPFSREYSLYFESGTIYVPPKILWILIHFSRKFFIILIRNCIFYLLNIRVDRMST